MENDKENAMFDNQQLTVEVPRLKKFALRLTGNHPDADDLVQATLLRAMEKATLFETGSNLWKWLSKMMYNLFVSDYRRKARYRLHSDPQDIIDRRGKAGAQEDEMDLQLTLRAMEQLPAERRQVIMLICVQDMSYQEVADRLGIPVGTVRSRLSRARAQLQSTLERSLPRAERTAGVDQAPRRTSNPGKPLDLCA